MAEITFGSDLLRFASGTSFIDQGIFNQVYNKVRRYVKSVLHIDTFEMLIGIKVNGRQGLQPLWGRKFGFTAYQLRNPENGDLEGQCALCYESANPLWIISEDQVPLSDEGATYIDLWSNTKEIPRYKEFKSEGNSTLISLPMTRADGSVFGVADFESQERLEPSSRAKAEFEKLAEAMASLYITLQEVGTKQEKIEGIITDLGEGLSKKDPFRLVKPRIFFAFSAKADLEVVGAIEEVLGKYSHKLEVRNWQRFTQTGNINQHIMEEISASKFGLCYLSERVESENGLNFQDNPNVLFEAGMLQALSRSPVSEPKDWVPVRETLGPPVPFDFSVDRVLMVSRNQAGELNRASLIAELQKRMDDLLR